MREIPVNKRYALGWYNEGVTHLNIREYEEAMSFFDKALAIIPDNPDFLIGKGDVLFAIGKFGDAYDLFAKVLEQEPANARAMLRAGTTLIHMNRHAEALTIFNRALGQNEYDGEFWLGQGIASFYLGEREKAAVSFKQASRYRPNQPALWYYSSKLASSDEAALQLLLRGYRLDNSNLDILLDIVEHLLNLERYAEAADYCKKAYRIDPGNSRMRLLAHRCISGERRSHM